MAIRKKFLIYFPESYPIGILFTGKDSVIELKYRLNSQNALNSFTSMFLPRKRKPLITKVIHTNKYKQLFKLNQEQEEALLELLEFPSGTLNVKEVTTFGRLFR